MASDILVKCSYCQNILEGRDYQNHMLSNHEGHLENWKKCGDCDKLFPNSFKLDIHKLVAHSVNKINQPKAFLWCQVCNVNQVAFPSKDHLRFHMNLYHSTYCMEYWKLCKFCIDERFETDADLLQHTDK